ncbi:SDR family NAD(P)-dependent oxidoreductase [Catenovulum sp. SM1970]|uniref:SDR family NAD(P)-dependent oxidoreductase n=1 Tax=Marinifaba aquimaris TaxID=2741323 RepID=UPI001572F267|nr:SDR family NAD(P)-dependent oxidoreductase [Marinifaba aquimaris]NTS75300.1 SDR family NAD(P)-dependent oxidoreductase [Marinifaba aquimaris]
MNFPHLTNANILVTGSSRGLGLAFVKTLSKSDVEHIYAGCRTQSGCDTIKELNLPNVTPVLLDVTKQSDINNLSSTISQLDLVINNAGIASACGFSSENALDISKAEMDVHYFGSISLIQALLPLLKLSTKAGIINISSIAGLSNFKAMGTYSASKGALHFLTQGLRAELSADDIFVQGVYPGPFDTRLAANYEGPKPSPINIAESVLNSYCERQYEVFPDEFSTNMHQIFKNAPKELEEIFSQ